MNYRGYHFFINNLELPYAPSKLKVSIGSNNKTVNLITGEEINVLKNPKLTEIEFDAELPRGRQYPFANKLISSKTYTDYFEKLKINKSPTQLVITRPSPKGTSLGGTTGDFESTVLRVSLESYNLEEDAENAYDIKVSLKFKQYVDYGVVKVVKKTTVPVQEKPKKVNPQTGGERGENYTVKKGDCLWNIAKKFYGNGTHYKKIYNANKDIIEKTAKKYGKKSSYKGSTPGWWIYPGTKLTIPPK